MSNSEPAVCPHCGQRAPIVMQGVVARCSVCGKLRVPFETTALNVAGRPSKAAGWATKAFGCWILGLGLPVSLGLFWLGYAIASVAWGLALGSPLALITLVLGVALLIGGRRLRQSGDEAALTARVHTIRAAASYQGGVITATDAARLLRIKEAEADDLLTDLAKQPDENVSVDVGDDGTVYYRFGAITDGERWRALADQVRVDPAAEPFADTAIQSADQIAQDLAELEAAERAAAAAARPGPIVVDPTAPPARYAQDEQEALAELEALAEEEARAEAEAKGRGRG